MKKSFQTLLMATESLALITASNKIMGLCTVVAYVFFAYNELSIQKVIKLVAWLDVLGHSVIRRWTDGIRQNSQAYFSALRIQVRSSSSLSYTIVDCYAVIILMKHLNPLICSLCQPYQEFLLLNSAKENVPGNDISESINSLSLLNIPPKTGEIQLDSVTAAWSGPGETNVGYSDDKVMRLSPGQLVLHSIEAVTCRCPNK